MKKIFLTPLLLIFVFCNSADSQSLKEKLNDYLTNCYEQGEFNGVALVSKNGQVIFNQPFGYSDFEHKKKLKRGSMFYLGSLAKQFTCTGIVYLKETKRLNYNDPIKKYLTDLPEFTKDITIRHLMTHTSGLPDYYEFMTPEPGTTNKDICKIVLELDSLQFEPGTKYSYSNTGYILLAEIIEKITGRSYKHFMERTLWANYAMLNTVVYDKTKPRIYDRVKGYNPDTTLNDYNYFTYGAGGIFSNVEDLFIWDQILYVDRPVSRKEMEAAYTPMFLKDSTNTHYGFGWRIEETDTGKVLSHSGGLNGFRTYFVRDLGNKNAIILLTNMKCERLKEISDTIRKILAGEEYEYLKPKS